MQVALTRRLTTINDLPPPVCTMEVSQYGIRMVEHSKDGVSGSHRGGESCLFYTFVKHRQDGVSVSHRGGESGLFYTFVKYRQDGVSVSHRGGESVVCSTHSLNTGRTG